MGADPCSPVDTFRSCMSQRRLTGKLGIHPVEHRLSGACMAIGVECTVQRIPAQSPQGHIVPGALMQEMSRKKPGLWRNGQEVFEPLVAVLGSINPEVLLG